MNLKVTVVCLVLGITLSQGAVVSLKQDALFDMVQSFLVNPDEFASALGVERVKRSTYDKEFSLNKIGVNIGLDYLDPNNKLKGGKADITIENLQRLIPKAKSEKVKLSITFEGGDSAKDGLFKLTVDYELHHANDEQGTIHVHRVKEGDLWVTKVSVVSKNNAAIKLIPVFELNLKSDHKTLMQGTYGCEHGHDFTINVDRVPGEKINAIIEGNGKTYIVEGILNKAEKAVKINIDVNGLKYEIDLDLNNNAKIFEFVASVNLGGSGQYKVEVTAQKDLTSADVKVNFNGRDLVSAKLKGKLDKAEKSAKYELRYSAVGVGEGKLRLGLQGGEEKQELKAQYMPKGGEDFKLEFTREAHSDMSRHIHAVITKGGENMLEYKNDIIPLINADSYELTADSKFDISSNSLLYPVFCSYGCFNTRTMHAQVFVEKSTPYKFSVNVQLTKDSESVLTLEVNSRNNPYVFKVVAPRLLPKILPTGRESIEFEADHSPGNYLRIKSNTNILSSFKIEKVDGDMRRVELNGKELIKASFNKGVNEITQTTVLPDGRSLATTISWASEDLKENKVDIKLVGTERNLIAMVEWNVKNKNAMTIKVDAKGNNKKFGDYEFQRDIKIAAGSKTLSVDWVGDSSIQNAPWPSPVHTVIKADIDLNKPEASFKLAKTVAGKSYAVTLNNGKFSIDM